MHKVTGGTASGRANAGVGGVDFMVAGVRCCGQVSLVKRMGNDGIAN